MVGVVGMASVAGVDNTFVSVGFVLEDLLRGKFDEGVIFLFKEDVTEASKRGERVPERESSESMLLV